LCEFSPIGRLFTSGSLWKISKVAKIFEQFFLGGSNTLIVAKIDSATFWDNFLTSSSGHAG
jgi:hypothetical protein